ncbi:hypothetical protein ACHWQZ_G001317 [Mnemiopsis leidyi]
MPEKIAVDIPKATKDIRIWTIEFYDRKLVIICNGKNFFEYKFSDSPDNNCMLWRKKPTHIMFYKDEWVQDTESDQFRNNPKVCTKLPESWSEVIVDPAIPVQHGEEVSVTCRAGFQLKGSDRITCNTYIFEDFEFETEPVCDPGMLYIRAHATD